MSNASSSEDAWFTRLEPTPSPSAPRRPDDPRLGERVDFWTTGQPQLLTGHPVLVGFPQDEGIRRNQGRPGAADAPSAIRNWLYRLTPWDTVHGVDLGELPLLDLGDVRISGNLEETQGALAEVVAAILSAGAIPIVLGGGHETAFGHFLGYVLAHRETAILNLDAHLDVRPCQEAYGHSGSPFRQALDHPTAPLRGNCYTVLGAQPHAVSRTHQLYVQNRGGIIRWASELRQGLVTIFQQECERLSSLSRGSVYMTLDADVVQQADVPGVSAANPLGLSGQEVAECASVAGACSAVSSFEVVEINPALDRDGQSARWAALVLWHFLSGLARRGG